MWELRHYPHTLQNGYGLPYPCCPHKEGPSVLLLFIQHIQHGFSTTTRKGAQVGPSMEWTGGVMSQDIYWDKLNCELNVVCEAFELFNCFFLFCTCTYVGWVQIQAIYRVPHV